MKRLVPIPEENFARLKKEKSSELGFRFVSVRLRDGRYFEQAVESEGCIIQMKGHKSIPFTELDVESVQVSDKTWNFRRRASRKVQTND
jgi:hypothetical protein